VQGPAARGGLAGADTEKKRWPRTRRAVGFCRRRPEKTLARSCRRATSKKRGRGTRLVERRWQRRARFSEEFSEGGRFTQRSSGAKMDAKAIVLEELKSGRNSEKLANALSLLTSLS
jgi:hypothetical protein